ncbi:hypothetical protein [Pseudomonas helleri]|uniref:hypothetical protein n=1 Tax=Pseudomonas helleri TaxID=1608996 RepID=UPI003FD2657A
MTFRKAAALSVGLLFVGLVGSLTVFLAKCLWLHFSEGSWIVARYIEDDFRRAVDYGVMAILPGLIAMTVTGCWFLIRRFNDPT